MVLLNYIYLFFLGAILGSFYGVLATRLPEEKSIVKPRSFCDNCKHPLAIGDLVPIFSYIFNLGKCRYCHKKVSIAYPLQELALGILFCVGYYLYGPHISYDFLAFLFLISLNLIIFISDFKYFIILDSPLFGCGIAIIILKYIFFGWKFALVALLSGVALFIVMYLLKIFGDFVFKRESLGGGDIKLALIVGIILEFKLGLCALILSAFLALPYSLLRVSLANEKEVPFGPFIISACTIVFLFMPKFINLLYYLFF